MTESNHPATQQSITPTLRYLGAGTFRKISATMPSAEAPENFACGSKPRRCAITGSGNLLDMVRRHEIESVKQRDACAAFMSASEARGLAPS